MVGLATGKVGQHKLDPLEKEKSSLNVEVWDIGELLRENPDIDLWFPHSCAYM